MTWDVPRYRSHEMTEMEKNARVASQLHEMYCALAFVFAFVILLVSVFQWVSVGFEIKLVDYIDLAEGVLVSTMIVAVAVVAQPDGSWLRRGFKYLHQKVWVEWC